MARRRKWKKKLPAELYSAEIESLAHDGSGIARIGGKTVFIHGALPGEVVTFRYTEMRSQYDRGRVEAVLSRSEDRVEPKCRHFAICGGCALQHLAARRQIEYKQQWLEENLQRIAKLSVPHWLEPLTGPFWGYRYKARLGVKYVNKKERVLVGFRERDNPYIADLECCEVLPPRIGRLLPELARLIQGLSIYNRLPQIEVALSETATGLSFRTLDPVNADDQRRLREFGQTHDIQIYLQPKGPETTYTLWPQDAVLEYSLADFDLRLKFLPYHFTQINHSINAQMIRLASDLLDLQTGDRVLDLFCGLGNFTLALARQTAAVVGVEGSQSLIDWARQNARDNRIANVRFETADLSADVSAQTWMAERYDKVLLDPPRSGALDMMAPIARLQPSRIVYVSCHPATLARDAGELTAQYGYKLLSAGVMDMFPHTAHVESIALFAR